ncbi:hypothetical protein [Tautonia marina]|uniref:hypothetical protein n=1 Tax=Tautonia marina TaxID=2653855 RepID=UPI001260C6AD|nr:hypothetical protein [Tautonia marina]
MFAQSRKIERTRCGRAVLAALALTCLAGKAGAWQEPPTPRAEAPAPIRAELSPAEKRRIAEQLQHRRFLLPAPVRAWLGEAMAMGTIALQQPPAAPSRAEQLEQWRAVDAEYERAFKEAQAELNDAMRRIEARINEAKQGAKRFAHTVIGTEGKLEYAASVAEGAAKGLMKGLDELFNGPGAGGFTTPDTDPFERYVRRCFTRYVLDADALDADLGKLIREYAARLDAIEAGLLVRLQADLPDVAIPAPAMRGNAKLAQLPGSAIDGVIRAATEDFAITMGRFVLAWMLGDAVEGWAAGDDTDRLTRFGINAAAGYAADKAMNKGLALGGYDPEAQVARRVELAIDGVCALLIAGDASDEHRKRFGLLAQLEHHPDPMVRAAGLRATLALEGAQDLGLRHRLAWLWNHRCYVNYYTLMGRVLGQELMREHITAQRGVHTAPAEKLIEAANFHTHYYGGK